MPDQDTVLEDNPSELDAALDANETGDSAPNKDNAQVTKPLILGKFKSEDELVKSYTEVEREKGRLAEEIGKIRSDMESLKRQSKLEEAVAAIANSKKAEDDPKPSLEAFYDELVEDGMPKEAAKKMTGLYNTWLTKSERANQEKIAALEQKFSEFSRRTAEDLERMTPEYQQNKDIIDEMVSGGMSLSNARNLVSKLMKSDENAPVRMQRATPPQSITPNRVTQRADAPKAEDKFLYTLKDIDLFREQFPSKSDDELKAMMIEVNEQRKARMSRGESQLERSYKNVRVA